MSLIFFICFFGLFNNQVFANPKLDTVILGGDSIGLQMNSSVVVVGFYEVETDEKKISPWEFSDIKEGDIIVQIDDYPITSNKDIATAIKNKNEIIIKLKRNNEYVYTNIQVAKSKSGNKSIGLYVKDKLLGVGTLTYIDPVTKSYGALGHSVNNGGNEGQLFNSTIKSIRKATPGAPGEKNAILSDGLIGSITKNTNYGIFGKMNTVSKGQEIQIQKASNVKKGKAQILTVVNGDKKEYFDIEIVEVKNQTSLGTKGIKIRITDKRLLQLTGGIIQGMSGSPIIQDGYLVGALSHVVVSSPSLGYGVFAEWMYSQSK